MASPSSVLSSNSNSHIHSQSNSPKKNNVSSSSSSTPASASTSASASAYTPAMSQVRVGVRIRPLTSSEKSQGGTHVLLANASNQTISLAKRKFTFDHVYDESISQEQLYGNVSDNLLNTFLEGYNATIMAYGQTGSGKTFTMGSECESHSSSHDNNDMNEECQGLIPRFMTDMFSTISQLQQEQNNTSDNNDSSSSSSSSSNNNTNTHTKYQLSASFLEVYGEEIHDLLHDRSDISRSDDEVPKSLHIREDASGEVTVVGLKCLPIANKNDALQLLRDGTLQRTTAATLMNHTSSRSHAVFTIYLQKLELENNGNDTTTTACSRLTFVDLAGSERMKRTGAEGERAREGIKINEGLLALGNVINALADEEKLQSKQNQKIHVPYRQSKLTRLLQDALGGNSQTLFLACVSPSDTNASETLSTLRYANRARNIKNKPMKNVDPTTLELKRLQALNQVLQVELVKEKFNVDSINGEAREDVQDYIATLYRQAEANSRDRDAFNSCKPCSRVFSSHTNLSSSTPKFMKHTFQSKTIVDASTKQTLKISPRENINTTIMETATTDTTMIDDDDIINVNPDEDMAILDQLLELQHHDQEFDRKQKEEQEQLDKVEGELAEQEGLLHQLRDNLKQYHNMKEKYENLMNEVSNLETEKQKLAHELDRVMVDPTKGCSKAIQLKLEKVEASLARARSETRKHQSMYRKAEQEAQKCKVLERKISELKQGKVASLKKQREDVLKHREYTEQKKREIQILKKKERKNGLQVSKLEHENRTHKLNLEKRKNYCLKLSGKLKQTELHLMRVLDMRKRDLQVRTKKNTTAKKHNNMKISRPNTNPNTAANSGADAANASDDTFAPRTEEIDSIKFLLERMMDDKVQHSQLKIKYEEKVSQYSEFMRLLVAEVKALDEMKGEKKNSTACSMEGEEEESKDENDATFLIYKSKSIQEHEETIEELELKTDLISSELEDLRIKIQQFDAKQEDRDGELISKSEDAAMRMVSNLSAPVTRTLLWEILDKLGDSMLKSAKLGEYVVRKDSALLSCESEINSLNKKIKSLSKDFDHRKSVLRKSGEFEMNSLNQKLSQALTERDAAKKSEEISRKKVQTIEVELAEAEEKVNLVQVAAGVNRPSQEAQKLLQNLQAMWGTIGLSIPERESAQDQISKCLEIMCHQKLEEAMKIKETTVTKLNHLRKHALMISDALGNEISTAAIKSFDAREMTLTEHVEALENVLQEIEPSYSIACDRREKIVSDINLIMQSIGPTVGKLSDNLKMLLAVKPSNLKRKRLTDNRKIGNLKESREKRAKIFKNVENMVKALEPMEASSTNTDLIKRTTEFESSWDPIADEDETDESENSTFSIPANSLSSSFLDKCENDVKGLRLIKSQIIVTNSQIRDTVKDLTTKIHLSPLEVLSITIRFVKKGTKDFPDWWDAKVAEHVCNTVTNQSIHVEASESFGKHLHAINDALHHISDERLVLSEILMNLVGNAHKTLLNTVEGATDTAKATEIFNEALVRLPPLSKDYIQACIDEINALAKASEGMVQSELETLMMVWESSDVTQSQRGEFWSEVEEATKRIETNAQSPFDAILQNTKTDFEEWLLSTVQSAIKAYKQLNVRLFKLNKIHVVVEKLRAKQDAKTKINSLDAEIRMISTQMTEFEEKASNKGRLLTKKMNSSNFLKEERFRKQMQAKFASKLESLGLLLQEWKRTEGSNFNSKTLSQDVRALLKNSDSANLVSWVEERTAMMHLKTVTSKNTKRRLTENKKTLSEIDGNPLPPQPRSGARGMIPHSPLRKKVSRSDRSASPVVNEKRPFSREKSYRIGTPPRKDQKLSSFEGSSYRAGTPLPKEGRIKRESILRSATPPIGRRESVATKGVSRKKVKPPSVSINGKKQPLTPRGSVKTSSTTNTSPNLRTTKPYRNFLDSPNRRTPPPSRTNTFEAAKDRDSKRVSILPFGNILNKTPNSKENKPPM